MFKFDTANLSAEGYILDLKKKFGIAKKSSNETIQLANNAWDEWEKQNVTKPKNTEEVITEHLDIFHKYHADIASVGDKLHGYDSGATTFFILPWNELNACAVTLLNGEKVILLDTRLISFLNELAILVVVSTCCSKSEKDVVFYENYFFKLLDNYLTKPKELNTRSSTNDFVSIIKKDYELTEMGAYCASAFLTYILCHEISHHILGHSEHKIEVSLLNMMEADDVIEINAPLINQEYEADMYGYDIFLEVIKKRSKLQTIKLSEEFDLMPLIFFELIDLLNTYALKQGMASHDAKTHPNPLDRKKRLKKHIDITGEVKGNEFYEVFMGFSLHMRERMNSQ